MRTFVSTGAWLLAVAAAAGCTTRNRAYCDEQSPPCPADQQCNLELLLCQPIDGGKADAPAVDTNRTLEGGSGEPNRLDGSGEDSPKGALGQRCTGDGDCASDHCADQVCCDARCSGICRSCALPGKLGRCTLVPAGLDPDQECGGSTTCAGSCSGDGSCSFPSTDTACAAPRCVASQLTTRHCNGDGACATDPVTDCGGYACDAAGDGCRTSCSPGASHCTGTFQCVGGRCVNDLPLGSGCGENDLACASTRCTDGVCCGVDDCGACQACGADGQCQPTEGGAICSTPSCTDGVRTIPRCQLGGCEPTSGSCGGFACAEDDCRSSCANDGHCIEGYFCNGSKTCELQRERGHDCTAANQCRSDRCTDQVCCSVDDCGACQACEQGSGSCAALPDGMAPAGDCPGDPDCGAGQCLDGACDYASPGTRCGKTPCSGQTLTIYGCDADHRCTTQQTPSCAPYRCNDPGTACRADCVDSGHCVAASVCDRTAAHEDGTGACVHQAAVAAVASTSNLSAAITNALGQGRTHLKLTGSTYAGLTLSSADTTVTLVGVNRPTIAPQGTGPAVAVSGAVELPDLFDPVLKLQNVRISGGNGTTGDGVNCVGGAVWLVESLIEGNTRYGLYAQRCGLHLRRCEIRDNAGGVFLDDTGHFVVNNLIVRNGECLGELSLLYGACDDPAGLGGLTVQRSHHRYVSRVYHNTIADNVAITAAALAYVGVNETPTNNLLCGNDAGWSCPTPQTCGPNDTVAGCTPSPSGDCQISPTSYRPLPGSSNINGGLTAASVTAVDKDDVPRPLGSGPDIGCYEVR